MTEKSFTCVSACALRTNSCMSVWVCVHVHGSVFITVYTLRVPLLGLVPLSRQVHWQAGRPWQLLNHFSLLFVSLLTVLRSCVTAHIAAPACLPFQGSWSETTNALAALLAASPARPELQTPVTLQDAHFVSCVCPKIVSICIFGNGNVCIINLYVRGIQRKL